MVTVMNRMMYSWGNNCSLMIDDVSWLPMVTKGGNYHLIVAAQEAGNPNNRCCRCCSISVTDGDKMTGQISNKSERWVIKFLMKITMHSNDWV